MTDPFPTDPIPADPTLPAAAGGPDRPHGYLGSTDAYLARLRRIEGQARGLQRMVEQGHLLHRHPYPGLGDDQGPAGGLPRPARGPPAPLRRRRRRPGRPRREEKLAEASAAIARLVRS